MCPEPGRSTKTFDTSEAPRPPFEEGKRSHATIARHLTKLRDTASAILALFAPHDVREAAVGAAVAPPRLGSGGERGPIERPKTPLEIRIERHASTIDRAQELVAQLNPEGKSASELPGDVREAITRQQRIARDVIDAELHFWSATIENNPVTRLDEVEQSWARRILGLADRMGCSPGHEKHRTFLRNWSENARH